LLKNDNDAIYNMNGLLSLAPTPSEIKLLREEKLEKSRFSQADSPINLHKQIDLRQTYSANSSSGSLLGEEDES